MDMQENKRERKKGSERKPETKKGGERRGDARGGEENTLKVREVRDGNRGQRKHRNRIKEKENEYKIRNRKTIDRKRN